MNSSACPVERTLSILGNRWVSLVVWNLLDGRKRHGELRAAMPGVSGKILTDRLRELELHGFVTRTVFAEVPVRVEYELTARGHSLRAIFEAMSDWGTADATHAQRDAPAGSAAD